MHDVDVESSRAFLLATGRYTSLAPAADPHGNGGEVPAVKKGSPLRVSIEVGGEGKGGATGTGGTLAYHSLWKLLQR